MSRPTPSRLYAGGFCLMLAIMPLLAVAVPRILGYGPAVAGLLFFALYPLVYKTRPPVSKFALLTAAIVVALAALSALWALDPALALERAEKLGLVILPGALFIGLAGGIAAEDLRSALRIVPVFFAVALVLLSIDYLFDYPLYRLTRGLDAAASVLHHELNRSTVACILLLLPMAALAANLWGRRTDIWAGFFLVLLLPAVLMTGSQSAQLALLVMLCAWFICPARSAKALYVLGAIMVAGILTAPWAAIALYHYAPAMEASPVMDGANAGARMEIWDYVSRYLLQSPLTGFGIEATRAVPAFDSHEIYQDGKTILHPHNFVLQVWIEFGAIGAVLLCGFFITLMRRLGQAPDRQALRLGASVLLGFVSVGLTGYGLWQGWWLGLILLAAALIALSCRALRQAH